MIGMNYCFTCDSDYSSMSNLNKHFRSKKHNLKSEIKSLESFMEVCGYGNSELRELDQLKKELARFDND